MTFKWFFILLLHLFFLVQIVSLATLFENKEKREGKGKTTLLPNCFAFYYLFRVLVGTGRACFETLRPLAYSLLAEIVHHVRGDLSLPQVFTSLSWQCIPW